MLGFFAGCEVDTAPPQAQSPAPRQAEGEARNFIPHWGYYVDPDHDCKVRLKKENLRLNVPGTAHDLADELGLMNAPRVLQAVDGDFTVEVKVRGTFAPTAPNIPGRFAYTGAGIVVMKDEHTYVGFQRAACRRDGITYYYANFELRQNHSIAAFDEQMFADSSDVILRVERRDDVIYGAVSQDGNSWHEMKPISVALPSHVMVGVVAVNSSDEKFIAQFEGYKLSPGE
jgi:regulation of enolase protein 1 (concanavalin A-like superfamily)